MVSDDCAVRAVWFTFVGEVFIETAAVALGIDMVADSLDKSRDNHRLCGDVGMEAVFARNALPNLIFRLAPGVEVGIDC
jgi:hypothetical protein